MSITSPCIRVCFLDEVKRICTGCGRTLDEIASWSRYDDEQREAVAAKLPARLEALQMRIDATAIHRPAQSISASTA